ncbi:MAG: squalene synthase HpnC [Planctomycetes bacterium]|nr:squalene synthase HpnC [Planctomycetota bacterium]
MVWDFASELQRFGPTTSPAQKAGLSAAHAYCAHVTRSHYENFTVVSVLLPRRLIRHFNAVYAYCRWSDDLADETSGGTETLRLLDWWRDELLSCYDGQPRHPVTVALRETIRRFDIPPEPFLNLLIAFTQDQHVKRYETFDQLVAYCRNSANPVGQLVLYLFDCFDAKRAALSDEVCTGLQLANFWQDIVRDYAISRVYLPVEDLNRFGVSETNIAEKQFTPQFQELMRFEVERARGYFDRGAALLPLLPRVARVDVDLFVRGGRAILSTIERSGHDVLSHRPEVSKFEKLKLFLGALLTRALG